jgi:hypothetical protein
MNSERERINSAENATKRVYLLMISRAGARALAAAFVCARWLAAKRSRMLVQPLALVRRVSQEDVME